ncbi:pyridoxamine 5'-phosphate oxidase family protein [Salinactinospora qingdaonensis]|uniref:Pyridoxamine 5'-phosphate oxidase family protein n=1 Tax=Salinactinospora qingdaonensis TaxID=702744 RepID=A0ABP7FGC2_9ACTN
MDFAMSRDDRETFLAEARVGILGVTDLRGEHGPVLAPVWYSYEPGGELVVTTGRTSLKGRLIRQAGRFSLCVQDETPPYRYVSVEGPATFEDHVAPAERAALAHRYLDPETAAAYLDATKEQLTTDVTFRMRPQRWRTADFSQFAKGFS